MKKYTVSFIALLAVCFLFTSCIFDLFDSGDNDDDSSSTSAEQSSSESQTAAEQYDANTFVQLENRSLYTVRVFRDSARGSAICTLKSGEKFVTGAKQTVEGTVYYLSYFVDVGMAVPWFDTNSVCYAAPKTGQTVSAFIYNPYSITTKNCYVVLENKSIETVVLKKGSSELLPANDNPSVILPPEATGIYEIKTVDFANFAVFNICTAGGLMIAHLSSFISKLEANRIYNVEISLQGGHAVPELKTVMPFDSAVKSKDCVITYQSERGTAPEPKTFSVGNALTAEYLPELSAEGFYFVGWYFCDKKIDTNYFIQGDTQLIAKWSAKNPISYTVKHYKQTTALGNNYEISETETLSGVPDFETEAVANSYTGFHAKSFEQKVIELNGNNTVSIFYDRNSYTVNFNANGGTGSFSSQTFYYGVVQNLRANTFSKFGYLFLGWSTSASGNVVYTDTASVENISSTEITLYAVWKVGLTEKDIADLDLSTLTEPFTLKFEGDITSDTLLALASKIEKASADITLDLSNATGLTELKRFGNNGTYHSDFVNCNKLKSVILPKCLKVLGENVFWGCEYLELVTLPEGVETINESVFRLCKNLKSIDIPNTVTSIGGEYTFGDCENLKKVTLPNNLTKLNDGMFYNCIRLSDIKIPDSVTEIGVGTFMNCYSLSSITIPKNVTRIDINAFNYSGLKTITIPSSVTKIGPYAFRDCRNLKSVTFEDTSNWYIALESYTNGGKISVSNPETNATYFTSNAVNRYWYKE